MLIVYVFYGDMQYTHYKILYPKHHNGYHWNISASRITLKFFLLCAFLYFLNFL